MAIAQTGKQRQQLAKVCVLAAGFWFCSTAWSVDNTANMSSSSPPNIATITNFAGITGISSASSAPDQQPLLGKTSVALARLQDITNRASELAVQALSMLGINYRYGGTSPETGLDCSGLVRYVFKEAWGTDLPRTSAEISRIGEQVDKVDLKPGDLVFYNTLRRGFSHVGIYLGDRKFIHSPSAGGQVRIEDMDLAYWKKRFNGARRIISGDNNTADSDDQK
ncbi:cell wall-associated NlpC family hydrolase [Herbaspirillum sp. Sphag1AN]|uniref:C40 family peptidase n=1 Tax=unclassified Herbaspirillum TaxID=2624150 RepID=UPI0016106951|nr:MULTISPECIES: C40 family peptidase [unclassified Herbaspirillum]MBB3211201.1 cell wall-associated NlpC family hydrolase [Herbaspirillum sp. Sphag1AN]MBB3244830.1 cell wall-associated NlpC family hydrolase [Herbaspirillum sp. Sphag64]